jgi:hypothetical protein
VGLGLGILTTESFTIIVLVAVLTSLMAPPLLRSAARHIAVTPAERTREKVLVGRPTPAAASPATPLETTRQAPSMGAHRRRAQR